MLHAFKRTAASWELRRAKKFQYGNSSMSNLRSDSSTHRSSPKAGAASLMSGRTQEQKRKYSDTLLSALSQ
jgi:hypothetical protein